ncbi:transmembrane protein 179 [Anthonomus grandis grandis]|uniref:transmembrane protein 179 n=1 Tax=Anthonomus grandis grandis TaxID=2921223 RepID=UPI002166099B|nr:transmembrane protein 179 [Anthonomus grandis grandis]
MALTNILLLSQIAGYVIALILSLCIIVPMSLQQDDFKGHCLLFSTGEWQESDGQLNVHWASQGYCNYTIFVGVTLGLVAIIQIYRLSVLLFKGQDSSFLSAFIDVVSGILLSAGTIIAACMITFGFMAWCENMTQRFPSCELAAGQDIDHKDEINTKNFYIELGTAQFGVWGSFAIWVGLTVCAIIKLLRYHQLENIRVSMFRERQRLINENADSPGSSLGRESTNTQSTATAE